ncbi:MAG TPA: hypothetical protein VGD71_12450 [Kribbella sp.]|jgi:hypothetical protein
MSTPTNSPDNFGPIADDRDVQAALQPRKTMNMPAATAVLVAIVVLAIGLAGGAGLHAAFAGGGSTPQAGGGGYGARGQGGYPQGQGQGRPGGGGAGGGGTVGTIVSADSSQLVVKTQTGNVTVKLTGSTAIEINAKGTVSDLKTGEQVVVNGTTSNGTLTADTVRQGAAGAGGGFNRPGASPSN